MRQKTHTYPYEGLNLIFCGTSITYGSNADPRTSLRWSTLLTGYLRGIETNHGVQGSTVEKRTPLDPYGGTNMLDRLSNIPSYDSSMGLLVFEFGTNDWSNSGQYASEYNVENFTTDYSTVLDDAIAKSWPADKILLLSPPYMTDDALSNVDAYGTPLPTRATMLLLINAIETLAGTYGTMYFELYDPIAKSHPDPGLIGDSVHPTNAGHFFIANLIHEYLIA